jgi:hypothetical protein
MPWEMKKPDLKNDPRYLEPRMNELEVNMSNVEGNLQNKADAQSLGDLSTLETTEKTSVVGATNEVKNDITNHLNNTSVHLSTTQKDRISNSIQGTGERTEAGTVSINFNNSSSAKINVTFAKPFTSIPNVVVSGGNGDCFGYTNAVTTTGFEFWLKHYEGVAFTSNRTSSWIAMGK